MQDPEQIRQEIAGYMDCDVFVRSLTRLAELKKEEEAKLRALAELQQAYVAANSEADYEQIKQMVVRIREMSKLARAEIRDLKQQILAHMSLEKANDLYERFLQSTAVEKSPDI
jgi:hypothetical protein